MWQSYGQDASKDGIYGQRYNANGNPQGMEFRVNEHTTNRQNRPDVAMDVEGNFTIVWSDEDQNNSIYARRYAANGLELGNEFLVNTDTNSAKDAPVISADANGNLIVAWTSFGQDGSSMGVFAQRYDAIGLPQGGEFRVNSYTTNGQRQPAVAMDRDGDFVIAWSSSGQDGSQYGIYSQRYRGKVLPCRSANLNLLGIVNGLSQDHTQGLINSSQLLQSGAQVAYQSGLSISLEPNFQVDAGVVFQALIDDCGL
ncbi:MAG: hypothetical protein IPL46_28695 [Saprospiraceae bacterium]|nr:hypothetical protein [Saprospiraceae bacterium]